MSDPLTITSGVLRTPDIGDSRVSDVLGQEHLHAIIEQVEEMLRTTRHTIIQS